MNKKITELEQKIKDFKERAAAFAERAKRFENELAEVKKEMIKEPEFKRVNYGQTYFFVETASGKNKVKQINETNVHFDNLMFKTNNYFHTKSRAQEVAKKIKFLLKLERLYDIYCPDFVPDWSNGIQEKFSVCRRTGQCWTTKTQYVLHIYEDVATTYFPTMEIAEKVCDILNAEEDNYNEM